MTEAVGHVGRAKFGETWTEVIERSRTKADAARAYYAAKLQEDEAQITTTSSQLLKAESLWDEVKPRYRSAVTRLRDLLSKGALTAFEFGKGELPRPIKTDFWGADEADHALEKGVHQGGLDINGIDIGALARWTPGGPQPSSKNRLVIVPEDEFPETEKSEGYFHMIWSRTRFP